MEFHFLRPYWFFAIIPISFIIYCLRHYVKKGNGWQQVIDPKLLNHLITQTQLRQNYWPLVLLSLIWLVSVLALAGPSWEKRNQPLYRNEAAKVILLDLSQSMLATDILPDRLTRAKYKVLDILNKYSEGQTGMVAFSSEAYTVSPLTNDTHTIALMLPDLSTNIMPVPGSNIGAALEKAESLLKQGNAKIGNIVLITDSPSNSIDLNIAAKIHADGYTISILGIGTTGDSAAPLNIPALEQLADLGGGRFSSFTNGDKDINYLLAPTLQNTAITESTLENTTNLWIDQGRWLLLLIIPFVLVAFRRGWFMSADQ